MGKIKRAQLNFHNLCITIPLGGAILIEIWSLGREQVSGGSFFFFPSERFCPCLEVSHKLDCCKFSAVAPSLARYDWSNKQHNKYTVA